MSELARLCYLIELCNVHARTRNNAYLRNYRATKRTWNQLLNTWVYTYHITEAQMLKNNKAYCAAGKRYNKARKKHGKEILKLKKKLNLRFQLMSMCPIVQNIYSLDYVIAPEGRHAPSLKLNGEAIRKLAFDYQAESTLLK